MWTLAAIRERDVQEEGEAKLQSLGMKIEFVETNKSISWQLNVQHQRSPRRFNDDRLQFYYECIFDFFLVRFAFSVGSIHLNAALNVVDNWSNLPLDCQLCCTMLPSKVKSIWENQEKTNKKWWKTSFFLLFSLLCQNFYVLYNLSHFITLRDIAIHNHLNYVFAALF